MNEHLRRCIFRPYRKGMGPAFTLDIWETDNRDHRGQPHIHFRLRESGNGIIFEGSDFAGSPLDGIDSDAAVSALMSFLTLRPGDTDAEYFDLYRPDQMEFCDQHAEALGAEVSARF